MMTEKALDAVEETLFIPLLGRCYASRRFPNYFYDKRAVELASSRLSAQAPLRHAEYLHMASACRQRTLDDKIRTFLDRHPQANVVLLGAGLDSAAERLAPHTAHFYVIDLPRVIDLRRRLLGVHPQETFIEGDLFALGWVEAVDKRVPTLIVAAGVFHYFDETVVVDLIRALKVHFPDGELVFDAVNATGLKLANRYVKKTGNQDATMHFCVDDPIAFATRTHTTLVSVDGFFREALKSCRGLAWSTRLFMYFADKLKRTQVIVLKLEG